MWGGEEREGEGTTNPLPLPPLLTTFIFGIWRGGRPGGKPRTFIFDTSGLRGLHFWAPRIAEIAIMPQKPNFSKITNYGVISPIFTPFREKGQKCPKCSPGGAPRWKYYNSNTFLGVFEAAGAQNAFRGEKCDFH